MVRLTVSMELINKMSFDAKVLKVLIASPGDVSEERQTVPNVLRRWNNEHGEEKHIVLLPVGWETESYPIYDPNASGPQSILNQQIVQQADIVIGIFWSKLGTATEEFASGTVEEIERSALSGKPVAVYFSKKNLPNDVDTDQLLKLRQYKTDLQKKSALTNDYDTLSDFREKLRDHLTALVNRATENLPSVKVSSQARTSVNGWTADDISRLVKAPKSSESNVEPFDSQFVDQLKMFVRKWDTIRPRENRNVPKAEGNDFMRRIEPLIDGLYFELDKLGTMEEVKLKLGQAQELLPKFHRFRFVMDGGNSYNAFWQLGSDIVSLVAQALEDIKYFIE